MNWSIKLTSKSDVARFLRQLGHILIRFALPKTKASVEILNNFGGDADVVPYNLLVRCYSADSADAPAEITIDDRSQFSIAKLQPIEIIP